MKTKETTQELLKRLQSRQRGNSSNVLVVSKKDFNAAKKIWGRDNSVLIKIPICYYSSRPYSILPAEEHWTVFFIKTREKK